MSVRNTIDGDRIARVIREESIDELNALALELVGTMQRALRDAHAIDTSALIGSLQAQPVEIGEAISLKVGTPVEHGAYVETGTRPHWAPIRPLYEWVERKLDVIAVGVSFDGGRARPTGESVRQFGPTRSFSRAREIYRIAKAIQRKIAHRGTRGRFFMKESLDKLGLTYHAEQRGGEYVYSVNVSGWLAARGQFWQRVEDRLARETR